MRTEIMRSKSQADNQALVAENTLLFAKYGIRKLRVESREGLGLLLAWLDNSDVNGVVGVTGPWMRHQLKIS